jgi:hypothetical protein
VFCLHRCSIEIQRILFGKVCFLRTLPQVVIVKAGINLREILHLYMFISLYFNCWSVNIFCHLPLLLMQLVCVVWNLWCGEVS